MTSKWRQPLHGALLLAACGMGSIRLAMFDKIVELRRETFLKIVEAICVKPYDILNMDT